ncbi:MAG: TIGR03560 family F420-dependent LLM class oxidoreductase [Acidimicrobiales bacterium]
MDARIFIEPQQGTSYGEVLALATRAEELGFDGFFTSEHLLRMGDSSGLPGPLDAWTTISGLARDTESLRLGTLVSPMTFHNPAQLAVRVAQIDAMSGGRVELGVGAGWYEAEHHTHGLPFPGVVERFDRLTESLEIISGLWSTADQETFTHEGAHFRVVDCPALPKPHQRPAPPIIVGGRGKRRTPTLAAQYASEFNVGFADPDAWRDITSNVVEYCEARERAPESLVWSAAQVAVIGATEADFSRRAAAIGREPAELRSSGVAGLIEEAQEKLTAFETVGCNRIYLQVLDVKDLDHLAVIAEAVRIRG